jgi:hypothetical protein
LAWRCSAQCVDPVLGPARRRTRTLGSWKLFVGVTPVCRIPVDASYFSDLLAGLLVMSVGLGAAVIATRTGETPTTNTQAEGNNEHVR